MERVCRAGRVAAGAGILVASAVAVALLVKGLYPADLPESRNPDFVDNVFDNRGVLWAARLLLVSGAGVLAFGGTFIVLSIGIRMKKGEWLRRAGPSRSQKDRLVRLMTRWSFGVELLRRARRKLLSCERRSDGPAS